MENIKERPEIDTPDSVHEPQNKNTTEMAVLLPNMRTKFRLTLEPAVMLSYVGYYINSLVQTNLFEERICLHSALGQNKSVNCYNMTADEQALIQPDVANLFIFKNLIESLMPLVTIPFLGPWSDVNGRLPLFFLSMSGMVAQSCMLCVFSTIPELPPLSFLLCSLPVALCGSNEVMFFVSTCYVIDITDFKTRAFRLSLLQSCICLGEIVGSFLSPLLYSKSPTYVYILSSILTVAGLLYTCIFLKESILIKEKTNTKLFNVNLVKEVWTTIIKKRCGYFRCIIILSALGLTLNDSILLSESSLFYLYLQKQFSWTLGDYSQFKAFAVLLRGSIPVLTLYVFSTKLKIPDMYLAIIAVVLKAIEEISMACSVQKWQIYSVQILNSVSVISGSLIRFQLSKIIPSNDLGKVYAFFSVAGQLGALTVSPLFTTIYNMTLYSSANFIFFFSSILLLFVFAVYVIITCLLSKSVNTEYTSIEN